MRFGKLKMFLFLTGFIAFGLMLYFGLWLLGGSATADIIPPLNANTIHVQYEVDNKYYTGTHLRNETPFAQKQVKVRYFVFDHSISRIPTFLGIYAEPLAWWLVFFIASSMLLLMPNAVFSKGTMFQLQKKFPWILMDEYFPEPTRWSQPGRKKYSPVKKPKRLDHNTEY
jgi:hypothetical protein